MCFKNNPWYSWTVNALCCGQLTGLFVSLGVVPEPQGQVEKTRALWKDPGGAQPLYCFIRYLSAPPPWHIPGTYWHILTQIVHTGTYWHIGSYQVHTLYWHTGTHRHTDIYWHILTHTDTYWQTGTYWYILRHTKIYWHKLTYWHIGRYQLHTDTYWHIGTYLINTETYQGHTVLTQTGTHWYILTHTDIYWHADAYWYIMTHTNTYQVHTLYWHILVHTVTYWHILLHTDICWHILTHTGTHYIPGTPWHILTWTRYTHWHIPGTELDTIFYYILWYNQYILCKHHVVDVLVTLSLWLCVQMQSNLWPGVPSAGGGVTNGGCVLGTESMSSSCMSPYSHPHGNLPGFMGMPASPGHPHPHHPHHHHHHHPHHHHPSHHPGINGLYSLHSFPGSLGPPGFEPGPEMEYKPTGLVALRMKAKEPGTLLSWPTWQPQCQVSFTPWLSPSQPQCS